MRVKPTARGVWWVWRLGIFCKTIGTVTEDIANEFNEHTLLMRSSDALFTHSRAPSHASNELYQRDQHNSIQMRQVGASNTSIPPIQIHGLKIPAHSQLFPPLHILNHKPLLISQMQQTDKPVRRADVRHLLPRVDVLEVVHYGGEFEGVAAVFFFVG